MPSSPFSNPLLRQIAEVLLVLVIASFTNSFLRRLIKVPQRINTRRRRTYVAILKNIISLIILFISLYIVIVYIGVNLTPLIASAGIIGIVVGISAHSVLDDLIAGFFLISQSKVAIGDYINAGSVEGTVVSIGLKSLTLRGEDGSLIIVPNGQVKNIVNYTYTHGTEHNVIDIRVKAGPSIDEILDIFSQVLAELETEHHKVLEESRIVGVKDYDGNNVTIRSLLITPHGMREKIDIEFRYKIIKAFEKKK